MEMDFPATCHHLQQKHKGFQSHLSLGHRAGWSRTSVETNIFPTLIDAWHPSESRQRLKSDSITSKTTTKSRKGLRHPVILICLNFNTLITKTSSNHIRAFELCVVELQ